MSYSSLSAGKGSKAAQMLDILLKYPLPHLRSLPHHLLLCRWRAIICWREGSSSSLTSSVRSSSFRANREDGETPFRRQQTLCSYVLFVKNCCITNFRYLRHCPPTLLCLLLYIGNRDTLKVWSAMDCDAERIHLYALVH